MKLLNIPNLLTLLNLCCGILASVLVLAGGDIYGIFILISISLIADFLDGMVARAMKISSPIGKELDSLADVISFGVTPGLMMLVLLLNYPIGGNALYTGQIYLTWLSLIGLMIPAFSALRLAKFNLDEEQSTYFKGLATPSNTLLIFSIFYIAQTKGQLISTTYDWLLLIAITVICSFLLIADLPLFALKFKGFAWRDNYYKYIFLMISLVLLIFFKFYAIPFIILLYIITSIIYKKEIIK
ncbi:CDP-alcohol phosphatidyltransferase family protein [Weeksella virosa]|uniref:CDP-alcohol phosphatidyltransferase family protein n=1 Tax=Weeksella virosa TaxID=1014 RepID=UPI002554DE48|nr:CDP-alcohol phosphatidyltransferase family protein [Weeksella virosa]MDK7674890.1 CDP-alcohol phosphatidyltransferase family protein [Weeksella virosa]